MAVSQNAEMQKNDPSGVKVTYCKISSGRSKNRIFIPRRFLKTLNPRHITYVLCRIFARLR